MKKLRSDPSGRNFSFLEAKTKIEAFCAYQERCAQEVSRKLDSWSITGEQQEQLLAHLISFNFLNEERFAEAFTSGKFRIKKWGRVKIRQQLKARNISEYSLKKALESIDPDLYIQTLRELAEAKLRDISRKKESDYVRKGKIFRFLSGKGFESDLVYDVLGELFPD